MISLRQLLNDDEGATAIEYSLIVSLIFLVIVGAVTLFAANTTIMWQSISTHI